MTESLEYIDSYFKGEASREQSAEFEKRILEQPDFAEEVAFYLNSLKAARDQAQEDRRNRFRELYRQEYPRQRPVIAMKRLRVYAAAAVLLAIISGWYLLRPARGPEHLADQYIQEHWQVLGVTMGSTEDSMQQALRLYNEGHFSEAGLRFEKMTRSDSANYEAKEYAGIAALRLGRYDQAITWFRQLADYKGLYAPPPALFYLSVALLKRDQPGDRSEARRLLQRVVNEDPGNKETARKWMMEF